MSNYTVDKDVPLPPDHGKAGKSGRLKYPWDRMSAGDSFTIPIPFGTDNLIKIVQSVRSAGIMYIRRNEIKNMIYVAYVTEPYPRQVPDPDQDDYTDMMIPGEIRAWWVEREEIPYKTQRSRSDDA